MEQKMSDNNEDVIEVGSSKDDTNKSSGFKGFDDSDVIVVDTDIDENDAFFAKYKNIDSSKNEKVEKDSLNDVKESEAKSSSDKEKALENKKDSDKEKASENKKDSDKEKSLDNKKESDKENALDDKKELDKEKSSGDKKKEEDKKDSSKSSSDDKKQNNKVSSSSKKLADAKAAAEKQNKDKYSSFYTETSRELPSQKKEKKSSGKKVALVTFLTLFSLVLVAYLAGFIYYSMHFYNDIYANGVNVSGMNEEAARQTLNNFYDKYELKVSMIDGKEEVIKADDIKMSITLRDEFKNAFKLQEPYLWFVKMFQHDEFEIGADTKWDDEALTALYKKWPEMKESSMAKPENAYVGVVDGKFQIVKEVLGNTLKMDTVDKTIKDSLTAVIPSVSLLDSNCYSLPTVYEDNEELIAELDAKNEYAENEIKIQLDDLVLEPGMELYEFVLEKSGTGFKVNDSKVEQYVNDLADKYDSYDKDREFTTSWDNRKITTHGTAFGYEMNREETITALINAINSKKSTTVEAVFDKKGKSLLGDNDIGDTYIEVNLSEQHVYAYKNGKLVADDDCVSGCESAGHGTCIGLYQIQNKLSPTVLRGEKKPVTKTTYKKGKKGKKIAVEETTYEYEYESPVTYWMQFNGGIGLHDAAGWRSSYGGSIYYYSGSHGCVNLPLSFAKTLYENFDIDTPVIVYFWDNANRK